MKPRETKFEKFGLEFHAAGLRWRALLVLSLDAEAPRQWKTWAESGRPVVALPTDPEQHEYTDVLLFCRPEKPRRSGLEGWSYLGSVAEGGWKKHWITRDEVEEVDKILRKMFKRYDVQLSLCPGGS